MTETMLMTETTTTRQSTLEKFTELTGISPEALSNDPIANLKVEYTWRVNLLAVIGMEMAQIKSDIKDEVEKKANFLDRKDAEYPWYSNAEVRGIRVNEKLKEHSRYQELIKHYSVLALERDLLDIGAGVYRRRHEVLYGRWLGE